MALDIKEPFFLHDMVPVPPLVTTAVKFTQAPEHTGPLGFAVIATTGVTTGFTVTFCVKGLKQPLLL